MSGFVRTTSFSKSVNNFFDKYFNRSSNIVEFFMKYDNAIAAQRHAQDKLNSETTISIPAMKTQLPIERHALELYTSRIFIDVHEEIPAACFTCTILVICNEGSSCAYQINDGTSTVDVVYDSVEESYTCSCRTYVRWGLLCRHIFVLFKDRKVRVIPDKYIVSRWTKNALTNVSLASGLNIIEKTDPLEKHKIALGQLYSEFYHTIAIVGNDTETLESIMRSLKAHRESKSNVDKSQNTKRRLFEDHLGAQVPDKGSVKIHPPALVHNKGSGKRIKSAAEIAFANSKKPLRLCKKCNQRMNHDSRNCEKFMGSAN